MHRRYSMYLAKRRTFCPDSISVKEYKGYKVKFQRGQMFIFPERASPKTIMRIGV